jgi:hypothetical protein
MKMADVRPRLMGASDLSIPAVVNESFERTGALAIHLIVLDVER